MQLKKKRRLKRALIGIVLFSILILAWDRFAFLKRLEQSTLDYRYSHYSRNKEFSDRLVLVEIDEQSMKLLAPSYGRWPWPRRIYKEMIEFLAVGEPSGVYFDLLFTEAQLGTDDDVQLAETSAAVGKVSHAMELMEEPAEEREGINPLPAGFWEKFGLKWDVDPVGLSKGSKTHRDYLLPAPAYVERVSNIHVVSFERDQDGPYRRARLTYQYDGKWLKTLALSSVLASVKDGKVSFSDSKLKVSGNISGAEPEKAAVFEREIPLDPDGTIPLHFYSGEKRPRTYRMAEIIGSQLKLQRGEVADPAQLPVNPFDLKDKIILVGASAVGLEDLKSTPVHPSYPGVLLHATAISNVLENDFLKKVPTAVSVVVALLVLFMVYGLVLLADNILLQTAVPLVVLASYNYLALVLFQNNSLWLQMALPTIVGLGALLDGFAYMMFVEGRESKKLKGTLSKYLSPAVAEQMVASGQDPTAEVGRFEELSVLFSDIRGFTTLSEKLEAAQVVEILNLYLGRMTDVIFERKGTLDKFIGDAIMAFWGAPVTEKDHALSAVNAAFGMRDALRKLKDEWRAKGKELPIEVGIGINSGKVIVGNIGSDKRLDYTVIGDNVNLASRVEGLTKQYGVWLLIGERTEELVRGQVNARLIDMVKVKGKNKPVKIFEPLDPDQSSLKAGFEAAWELYRLGKFEQALKAFESVDQSVSGGDRASQMYVERCKELIAEPPTEWDGTFTAKSK